MQGRHCCMASSLERTQLYQSRVRPVFEGRGTPRRLPPIHLAVRLKLRGIPDRPYLFMNSDSTNDRTMISVRITKITWLVLGRFDFLGCVLPLAILHYAFLAFLESGGNRPLQFLNRYRFCDVTISAQGQRLVYRDVGGLG